MACGLLVEGASLVERRLSGTGSVVVALGLGCSKITGDLPGPGIQPVSLCWQEASYPLCHHEVQGSSFKDRLEYRLLVG